MQIPKKSLFAIILLTLNLVSSIQTTGWSRSLTHDPGHLECDGGAPAIAAIVIALQAAALADATAEQVFLNTFPNPTQAETDLYN